MCIQAIIIKGHTLFYVCTARLRLSVIVYIYVYFILLRVSRLLDKSKATL